MVVRPLTTLCGGRAFNLRYRKAPVTPDRTIRWSHDWLRFGQLRPIGNVCCYLPLQSHAVVYSLFFLIGEHERYDQSWVIVRLVVAINDQSYHQSWPPENAHVKNTLLFVNEWMTLFSAHTYYIFTIDWNLNEYINNSIIWHTVQRCRKESIRLEGVINSFKK